MGWEESPGRGFWVLGEVRGGGWNGGCVTLELRTREIGNGDAIKRNLGKGSTPLVVRPWPHCGMNPLEIGPAPQDIIDGAGFCRLSFLEEDR